MGMLINRHRDRHGDTQVGEPAGTPSEDWTIPQLKAYASSNEVDLSGAKKKADILSTIVEAVKPVPAVDPPADDAGREDWLTFVTGQGITVTEGASTEELREAYTNRNQD